MLLFDHIVYIKYILPERLYGEENIKHKKVPSQ